MPATLSAYDVQEAALLAALRDASVAGAAGVAEAQWASVSSSRVMVGDRAGYVAGLHRGRLPAIEAFVEDEKWDHVTRTGGTMATTWVLRIHAPGPFQAAASRRLKLILAVARAVVRLNPYFDSGEGEEVGAVLPTPMGFALECRVRMLHSYDRLTYETDATITPGGGESMDLTYPAATTIGGGRVVRFDPTSGGRWILADHTDPDAAGAQLAVSLGAAIAGAQLAARAAGIITDPAFSYTPGPLFLGTAGALVSTPPTSGFLREVAHATAPTTIVVEPEAAIDLTEPGD